MNPSPPSPPPAYSAGSEPTSDAAQITDPRPILRDAIHRLQQMVARCSYSVHYAPMCGWEGIVTRQVPEVMDVLAPLLTVTSSRTDKRPHPDVTAPTAQKGTPDLAASTPDLAVDVAGTTP